MSNSITIESLQGKDILALVSGGLDSVTFTSWATAQGVKVNCFTADLGQPDEKNINDIEKRMMAAGGTSFTLVDGKKDLVEAGILLLMAGAGYEGGYLNTTGIARVTTTQLALPVLKAKNIGVLSHGATGRGNDQVRFQLYANMLNPKVQVYAPWRDPAFLKQFPGRKEMISYCESKGLPVRASHAKPYSTDANILGLTHEAGKLEFLDTPARFITPEFGKHPKDAPDAETRVSIEFKKGVPVAINGQKKDLVGIFEVANKLAGDNGVGIGIHTVENRYVGIKSRGVYEQPGMQLLNQCYKYIYQLILDRRSLEEYQFLSNLIGRQIYEAAWFHPSTAAALKAIRCYADTINGVITVDLYKGNVDYVNAEFENVLYSADTASMEDVGEFNHADAEGFLSVLGVSAKNLSRAHQVWLDAFKL